MENSKETQQKLSSAIAFNSFTTILNCEADRLTATHEKELSGANDRCVLQFYLPSHGSSHIYFECKMTESKEQVPYFGIGFAPFEYNKGMVGWYEGSIGYHSDDGGIFEGPQTTLKLLKYSTGKTVGCYLDTLTKKLFFTLDGEKLEKSERTLPYPLSLFPTITFHSKHGIKFEVQYDPCNSTYDKFVYKKLRSLTSNSDNCEDAGKVADQANVNIEGLSLLESI